MSLRDSFYVHTFAAGFKDGYPFQNMLPEISMTINSEATDFVDGYFSDLGFSWNVLVRLKHGGFAIVYMGYPSDKVEGDETAEFEVWPTFYTYANEKEASMALEAEMESEEENWILVHMEKGRDGIRDNVDFEKCYEDLRRIAVNRKMRLGYSKEEAEAFVAKEEAAAELPSEDEKIGGWADGQIEDP